MSTGTAVFARMRKVLLVAALALAALPAAPSLADTTIGTPGSGLFVHCGFTSVMADNTFVVPAGGGTITSFSFVTSAANTGQSLHFLVLRPSATPGSYTVVGKTGLVTLAGTGGAETFAANIPAQAGDFLGFWSNAIQNCAWTSTGGGELIFHSAANPNVGGTLSFPLGPFSTEHVNVTANLRPPGPTSKAECKNGGWKSFGSMFKNQGACVTLFDTDA